MKPVRVLFAYHAASRGGVDETLQTLVGNLERARFTPTVLLPQESEITVIYERMGVDVIVLRARKNGFRIGDLLKLFRVVRKFDVVYGSSFCKSSRNVGLAARLAGKPFVWHIHEVVAHRQAALLRWLGLAERVVVVSEASRKSLPISWQEGCTIIPNPIEPTRFHNNEEMRQAARRKLGEEQSIPVQAKVCLTVGRISREKGFDLLIKIAEKMIGEIPEVVFCMAGEWAGEREAFLEQVRRLGLEDHFRFPGFQEDVVPFLQAADVMLHPSRFESLPRVVVEAMASGLPVVAFDVGGTAELVEDGKSGFLVAPFDVNLFAGQAVRILREDDLRLQMGAEGRRVLGGRFGLAECMAQVEEVILDCVESRPGGRAE